MYDVDTSRLMKQRGQIPQRPPDIVNCRPPWERKVAGRIQEGQAHLVGERRIIEETSDECGDPAPGGRALAHEQYPGSPE